MSLIKPKSDGIKVNGNILSMNPQRSSQVCFFYTRIVIYWGEGKDVPSGIKDSGEMKYNSPHF